MKIEKSCLIFIGDATSEDSIATARELAYKQPEYCLAEYATRHCKVTLDAPRMTIWQAAEQGIHAFVIGHQSHNNELDVKWLPTLIEALEAGMDIIYPKSQKIPQFSQIKYHALCLGRRIIALH